MIVKSWFFFFFILFVGFSSQAFWSVSIHYFIGGEEEGERGGGREGRKARRKEGGRKNSRGLSFRNLGQRHLTLPCLCFDTGM